MLPLLDCVDERLAWPASAQARAVVDAPGWSVIAAATELLADDTLTADDAAAVAARLWMRCGPAPMDEASPDFWRELFGRGGYAVNGRPSGIQIRSRLLWRGADPQWARGWAWADKRRVAELHASANGERTPVGRLWRTRGGGDALLGSITHLRDSGAMEWVVDPDRLGDVEPVDDVDPDPKTWVTLRAPSHGPLDDPPPPAYGPGYGARLLLGW